MLNLSPARYPQHPEFGTPCCWRPDAGFLDAQGRHLDGRMIARYARSKGVIPGEAHISEQLAACGLDETMRFGSTPWPLPYSWEA